MTIYFLSVLVVKYVGLNRALYIEEQSDRKHNERCVYNGLHLGKERRGCKSRCNLKTRDFTQSFYNPRENSSCAAQTLLRRSNNPENTIFLSLSLPSPCVIITNFFIIPLPSIRVRSCTTRRFWPVSRELFLPLTLSVERKNPFLSLFFVSWS